MTDFDEVIGRNTQEHNPHWPQIPNHSYRILIVGSFGSWKTNVLISIINHQPEIHKIFLHAKDPYVLKYQYLKKMCEWVGLKNHEDPEAFMEEFNDIKNVYKSIEDCNPGKARKFWYDFMIWLLIWSEIKSLTQ